MSDKSSADSAKKSRLVRDSFTMPRAEYAAIDELKERALKLGVSVKKSELLRAGLMLLKQLSDTRLTFALQSVPTLKTGRPTSLKISASVTPATRSVAPGGKAAIRMAPTTRTSVAKVPIKAAAASPVPTVARTVSARISKAPQARSAAKKAPVKKA
jgi:hypothetical protein